MTQQNQYLKSLIVYFHAWITHSIHMMEHKNQKDCLKGVG